MTIHGNRMPQPDELGTVDVRRRPPAEDPANRSAGGLGSGWFTGLGRRTGYVFAQWPLALAAFIVVVTLLAVGAGLSITVIGLPVLALAALGARVAAHAERSLQRRLLGRSAPTPAYRRADGGWLRRTLTTLGDPQSWLDIVWALVGFVLSTVTWAVGVAWWSVTVGALSWPLWSWSLPDDSDSAQVPELIGLGRHYVVDLTFYLLVGLLAAVTLPWVMRVLSLVTAAPAEVLLCGRARWQRELDRQRDGRSAARSAQSGALRRLERDIHDGPQQRLVRLGMDLGRAKQQMTTDPQRAGATLDEAIAQTRATLDELRALSRGIAPPVLVDRGLVEALRELVTRATVPVHLTVEIDDEVPEDVQTAAYFVVSEALTNVAKHAMATYALVDVRQEQRVLVVSVQDDGVGGAQLAKGHGLLGLSDRARAVDGLLTVSSPPGGPTEVRAELPCGS